MPKFPFNKKSKTLTGSRNRVSTAHVSKSGSLLLVRILAVLVLLATMTTWSIRPASACSCAGGDPRERLENSVAAFVGRAISHVGPQQGPIMSSADPVTYTFEIETSIKGDLGDQVEVVTAASGISCGFEGRIANGERAGIFLRLDDDENYRSGLCSTIDPDILLEIAGIQVPPNGSGPLRYLLGGRFGEARVMALDSQGRTLAYGQGTEPTGAIAVCPGNERIIEIYGSKQDMKIGVRDLSTFEIVNEVSLFDNIVEIHPEQYSELRNSGIYIEGIREAVCLISDGSEAAFFTRSYVDYGEPGLVGMTINSEEDVTIFWNDQGAGAAFSPDRKTAYVVEGTISDPEYQITTYVIWAFDMSTGTKHKVASFPRLASEFFGSMSVSPNNEMLVVDLFQENRPRGSRLVLVNVDSSPAEIIETPFADGSYGTRIMWMDGQRILLMPNNGEIGTVIYDTALNVLEQNTEPNRVRYPTISGEMLHGFNTTGPGVLSLTSFDLGSGDVVEHRKFDQHDILALVAVDGLLGKTGFKVLDAGQWAVILVVGILVVAIVRRYIRHRRARGI